MYVQYMWTSSHYLLSALYTYVCTYICTYNCSPDMAWAMFDQWMNCSCLSIAQREDPPPANKGSIYTPFLQPHFSSMPNDDSKYTLVWLLSVLSSRMHITSGRPIDNHPHYVEWDAALFPTFIYIAFACFKYRQPIFD